MGREVPERVRDGELDPGQHEALPEVPDAHREEPGLQPHVLLAVQVRVLLDVHGRLVSRGVPFRCRGDGVCESTVRRRRDVPHRAEHGATTGGFYKCNRFDPSKDNEDDQSDTAKAKRELDRYLHYYKRYHGHDQAQKFATKQLEATEKRMMELQETTSGSWIDVQFLKAANEMVIDCRRVLKYTYVFGYYLDPKKNKMKELFENLQEHLEKFTEQLSEMTELPVDQMDRTEIVNVTRVTESFLVNLIKGTESGLDVPVEPPPAPVSAK